MTNGIRAILGLLVLGGAGAVVAQQARDDGGAGRLQAMVQQLTTERTQLQAENKEITANLDAANAELKTLREQKTALERRLGQAESSLTQASTSNTRTTEALEQMRARTEELIAQYRETVEVLRQTELERNELRVDLAQRDSMLKTCVTNNQKLFDTGIEVLDHYEDKGCWSALRENEPFTGNKRVQLQNLVDEYRWRLEDELLPANSPAAQATSDASTP